MESNQDINVLQVVNWLKLVFPNKYSTRIRDETHHLFINYGEGNQHVGFLYEELDTIYLCIFRLYYEIAINTIVIDLKTEFILSERYTKIGRYTKEIFYMYKITFKE